MDSQKGRRKRRKRRKHSKNRSEEETACEGDGKQDPPKKLIQAARPSIESIETGKSLKKRSRSSGKNEQRPSKKPANEGTTFPFQVDATDHCETPLEAYRDVATLLDRVAKSLDKKSSSLVIYDPYYCDGGVRVKLNSLGFSNVINENENFYANIESGKVPDYDVLVTNPPYSGVHVERLLTFVTGTTKPFLLLLPHYVYTKDYYQRVFQSKKVPQPFFLVPKTRYSYKPPSWVEKGSTALNKGKTITAPFPSFWYCHAPTVSSEWLAQTFGTSGVYRHDRRIQYCNCTAHIPRDMKGEFDSTKKRPNPKARKRAAAKKRAAMAGF